ncbi:MAG: type IV pilus twitching motility protein PilT [Candidatus Sumerlaeota bacterium]|nr:type IV pilus twitching motility protein PilT [Candidatus Sumerlaeota bacterium]
MEMSELLRMTFDHNASDLHIAVGRPPVLRVDGSLKDVPGPMLTASETRRLIYGMLTDIQKQKLEQNKELDFSLSISQLSRFRVNVHFQRGTVAAAFRLIPTQIRTFYELGLPSTVFEMLGRRPTGFVLITGPTGSGKSTTLAAMIDMINEERECHIITIEDPIEYLHPHKKALVEQREINEDSLSFQSALKFVLRQDPDVILVGEMRDLETTTAAITAAETGHLVFSTLHTVDVAQTIDRIIDIFPAHQRDQIRMQLSGVLEGVACQRLIPSARGKGRELAVEIMTATDAVRNLVREGKTHQLPMQIEAGRQMGMQTMDRALLDLFRAGRISREEAMLNAKKIEEMKRWVEKSEMEITPSRSSARRSEARKQER